ncbi:type VI secretion system-associated FHA domain protein TagH [Azospirillum doebereinerae]|uniref:type VI secretion system-associated FHA domain protein TagH n=1 Tax=Azospirillum doebereinerae TaxID=92933 RepID=UPI001EE54EDD|nr:type VI secretion system-associated FHA domain protein TagH [Azospirillum doebereinerae]MCG5240235.1 type VI secretion system-associated FHA domain protein TagH [Azospirillum doebereinerae]
MKLRLTLIQGPPSQGGDLTRDLGTGRLVIGRGVECDWALSDPERALSKTHCMVEFKGGVYVVIDSSTNGVFLNDAGAPIGRGNSAVIGDGDRLRLGGYVIRAGFAADEAPPANDPFLAVLRSGDTPAASGGFGGPPAADDPFAPSYGRGAVPMMPIPEDDDLFGERAPRADGGWDSGGGGSGWGVGGGGGSWQPTAAGNEAEASWPKAGQVDFAPDDLGTMRVATDSSGIPDDWLDEPLSPADLPSSQAPSPFQAPPPAPAASALPDDWGDEPLVPPAFGRAPAPTPFPAAPATTPTADQTALTRALVDVVMGLVRRQAALEAMLGLDPDDTLAQGDSPLRRAVGADDALARLSALPAGEAEALLRAVTDDGAAHQSALLAAIRELAGETTDGDARLAALYRRLLPIHRQVLGG